MAIFPNQTPPNGDFAAELQRLQQIEINRLKAKVAEPEHAAKVLDKTKPNIKPAFKTKSLKLKPKKKAKAYPASGIITILLIFFVIGFFSGALPPIVVPIAILFLAILHNIFKHKL